MSTTRPLPRRHNPLILPEASPDYEELLSRRRLGKTYLSVKPGQIGTSNATKPENLGLFEYAHLRAPIPKDLRGSEIFSLNPSQQTPNTYFLMRRSRDGYVSATGMFKIAFPWAKHSEEKAEREYLKTRPETSEDEVAGNIWISPELALELAKEYKMVDWVRALLDPRDIAPSSNSPEKNITPPPKFEMPPSDAPILEPPSLARNRTRRSASPAKATVSGRKIATPRKPRQTRAQKESSAASSSAANESLQDTLDAAASTAELPAEEKLHEAVEVNGQRETQEEKAADEEEQTIPVKKAPEHVTVNVESTEDVDTAAVAETSKTNVFLEMPASAPELPLPQDTETMIATAKEMVEEATKLQEETLGNPSSKTSKKRKAQEEKDGQGDSDAEASAGQPAKRAKILENTLRRERVRNRALIGVTATLALAATIPYFF
ncbi:hypothetical protein VTO42DRAFT_1228 [Malbranchea cinnamomea]